MSSLINPKCLVPLYLTDKITAISCSKLDSYILVIVLTIIALCCIISIFYNDNLRYNQSEKYTFSWIILLSCFCISIVIIIATPFVATRSWQGYQEMYNAYGTKGINQTNAALNLQAMEQTNISANAVRNGAYAIALSNLLR